jgi:glycosyltransferase involved in cell wall biosynthesis
MTKNSRIKVLVSAFACEPDEGSEPEVGWKWAQVMARSCDITVVTQRKNQPRIEQWYREHPERDMGIRYSYLELGGTWRWLKKHAPGGIYGYYAIWQWRLRSHVAKLLAEQPFDLIHHVTFASFRMPVFVTGRPVVWGPVGGAESAPMHLLAGHGTVLGRMRERCRNLSTWLAGKLVRTWEPTRRSRGIALASTPATAELLQRNRIKTVMMPTIGYDADPLFSETRKDRNEGALRLLFVGRLHLLKGLHLVLQAIAGLEPGKVHLTVVGDGAERRRLQKMAHQLNLGEAVSFRGFVPRAGLAAVFSEHDVIVAPSLYESGGLSVLEGFAHGLPAIVLDCGGHALSVDETCGMKIPPCRSQAEVVRELAAAITAYADDRDLPGRHGSAARTKLSEAYSWQGKHDAMLAIYREGRGR